MISIIYLFNIKLNYKTNNVVKYIITNYKDKTINNNICIVIKMSQKSIHSLNIQNQSPIKNTFLGDDDHNVVPPKISTSKKLPLTSPMFSYFGDSHVYLNRKYSENNRIDLLHSNNFPRKDSLCPNDETKDNEEENGSNIMYSEENEDEDEENEEEDEEYGQLNANGVYNQQYKNQSNNNISSSNQNTKNNIPLFRFNLNQQFNLMTLNQIQQQQRPRFNSGNFILQSPNRNQLMNQNYLGNMYPNNPINNYNNNNNQAPYQVEMFGRKGWLCHVCNNFNYDTRNKCNRCHESRSPKKNKKKNSNQKIQMNIMNSAQNINNKNNKNNKLFSERIGDWTCFHCNNLNFAFRTVCNRCQLSKEESDAFLMKFQMNNINSNEGEN